LIATVLRRLKDPRLTAFHGIASYPKFNSIGIVVEYISPGCLSNILDDPRYKLYVRDALKIIAHAAAGQIVFSYFLHFNIFEHPLVLGALLEYFPS
jgi:hypothetical protein